MFNTFVLNVIYLYEVQERLTIVLKEDQEKLYGRQIPPRQNSVK